MAASTSQATARPRFRRIHHPAFAAAIATLIVNDRLFKEQLPGLLSGKLSDAAGLFLIGALGFDALDRLGAGVRSRLAFGMGVALPFIAAKTIPAATAIVRDVSAAVLDIVGAALGWLPLIPSDGSQVQIITDPTDLLMLPALALPLLLSSRSAG